MAEHDALLAKNRRELEGSRQGTPKRKVIGSKDCPGQQRGDPYAAPAPHQDPSPDTPTTTSSINLDSATTLDHEEDDRPDTNEGVEQVMDLGFGHCKLQAQAPERGSIDHPAQLIGKNVVTSFVGVTEQYFRDLEQAHAAEDDRDSLFEEEREATTPEFTARIQRRKLRTRIKYVGGSVEAACALGVADGIVDLVGMLLEHTSSSHSLPPPHRYFPPPPLFHKTLSARSQHQSHPIPNIPPPPPEHTKPPQTTESGETMKAAGLKAIATVLSSTAVLIKSRAPSNPPLINLITNRIRGGIPAQKYILCQYNIPRSLLDRGAKITPGKRAPTITALEDREWVAVSSMVEKSRVAVVMDELTGAGATDVLVFGISNAR